MSKKRFFLLTPQGHKLVLEFARNLTPQILLFSISLFSYLRGTEEIVNNFSKGVKLYFLSFFVLLFFTYLFLANFALLINNILNLTERAKHQYSVKKKHLCIEGIIIFIFLTIGTLAILFVGIPSALNAYQYFTQR